VTVDELRSMEDTGATGEGVVLADVRSALDGSQGHHTYLEGHLPGAVFIDVDADLAAPPTPREGRHPLPTPERFAEAMGARGIGHQDRVVAYDTAGGTIAARLVWLLRAIGQDAAVLSGGLVAWDGPLEAGEVRRPQVVRTPVPWPAELLADADEVATLAGSVDAVVVDARAPARFRGESEPIDAVAGHVPGARNLPTAELMDAEGRLLGETAIRTRADELGIGHAREVVAYCGSGVTACFDLLALESAGIRGRLYPGSWSAWSGDPERAVATGD
jgi:thiosulfate/3-mercaptopyruvate sulfurtransferase